MPHMFEFLDKEVIQALNEKLPHGPGRGRGHAHSGHRRRPRWRGRWRYSTASKPAKVVMAKDDEEAEALYQIRAMAYLAIRDLAPAVQVEDIAVPIDRLTEYLMKVRRWQPSTS